MVPGGCNITGNLKELCHEDIAVLCILHSAELNVVAVTENVNTFLLV